ncbi:phospholipase D-like domain-containing protein [Actinocorallia sp. B10E7]|uniref:phospholipase D-like domain-containing protein n=1 Tax=Actinocorallia sp. B10E7 TaxID=3153558 RepID=UPI00325D87E9
MAFPPRVFWAFVLVFWWVGSGAASAGYAVPEGAVFNRPSAAGTGEENTIQDRLLTLIRHTPGGAEIKVAIYAWREEAVKDALLRAHERGVRVKVLMNHAADTGSEAIHSKLVGALGEYEPGKESWAAQCVQGWGCLGTGINHNKFILFSQVGTSRNVVVQSSANLTYHDRIKFWNNAYIAADAGLYRLYDDYFRRLETGIGRTTPPDDDEYQMSESGPYRLYTNPYQGPDMLVQELDALRCSPDPARPTRIRVTALLFNRTELAEKLVSLQDQGCRVHLAFRRLSTEVSDLFQGRLSGVRRCSGAMTVHSKYMAISTGAGTFEGRIGQKVVFTGSHNYGRAALRNNDETLLRIVDPRVHRQYEENFDDGPYLRCPEWEKASVPAPGTDPFA